MDKRAYEKPTKDNVESGDFLATEVGENIFLIPINAVKEYVIDTVEYRFNENNSVISTCPYSLAIIQKKNKTILIGREVDESFLEKVFVDALSDTLLR